MFRLKIKPPLECTRLYKRENVQLYIYIYIYIYVCVCVCVR